MPSLIRVPDAVTPLDACSVRAVDPARVAAARERLLPLEEAGALADALEQCELCVPLEADGFFRVLAEIRPAQQQRVGDTAGLPVGHQPGLVALGRRKLFEVHAATGSAIAQEALVRIAALFKIEVEINGLFLARFERELDLLPALADDSGLEVSALGGAPGVRSKRWSGRGDLSGQALDDANNAELLHALGPFVDRRARYRRGDRKNGGFRFRAR